MTAEPVERKQLKPLFRNREAEEALKKEAFAKLTRQELFEQGFIKVADLDDEELRYGRCRDTNTGIIPGKTTKTELIPKALYDEMVAEHEARFKQKLRQNLDDMLDGMVEIAKDDTVEPKDRLEAMKYLIDRTAGRATEHVSVQVHHAPWEELLNDVSGIAPVTRDQHRQLQRGIIDVEVVDEEEAGELGEAERSSDVPPQPPEPTPYGTADTPNSPSKPKEEKYTGQLSARPPSAKYPSQEQPLVTKDQHQLSYAEQARNQELLAERRAAAKKRIQGAKKARKVARAMGADAIKDEITGTTVGEDGQVSFETKK
jgi:hypothetical protein